MRWNARRWVPFVSSCFCLAAVGCGGDAVRSPGSDAGLGADASDRDSATFNDAALSVDAGGDDAGTTAFGAIVGTCGRVVDELDEETPSYFELRFDFGADPFDDPLDRPRLTSGAQEILSDGTAGGSSGISEAFAFEVLARCEGATLVKTETEIVYDPPSSKKTDILVALAGVRLGVSVTRAVSFPPEAPYTETNAAFIEGKLDDILVSSANVVEADAWVKQALVVMAYGDMHAATIRAFWESLDAETRADTVMYVVVTDGPDEIVYFER